MKTQLEVHCRFGTLPPCRSIARPSTHRVQREDGPLPSDAAVLTPSDLIVMLGPTSACSRPGGSGMDASGHTPAERDPRRTRASPGSVPVEAPCSVTPYRARPARRSRHEGQGPGDRGPRRCTRGSSGPGEVQDRRYFGPSPERSQRRPTRVRARKSSNISANARTPFSCSTASGTAGSAPAPVQVLLVRRTAWRGPP